jgi:hypothetical protein
MSRANETVFLWLILAAAFVAGTEVLIFLSIMVSL